MGSPVTLDDVAARAGVSRWTVAAAMRGRGRVNAETARRLRALAAEMGYDPALTQAGRSLAEARHGRLARNHQVAVVLPADDLDLPYYAGLLRGTVLGLAEGGSAAVVSDVWRVMHADIAEEARFGAAVLRGRVDAAIIHPTDQAAVARLMAGWRQARFGDRPVVALMRPLPGLPCAGCDHVPALIAALRLLLSLGHRRLAWLRWAGDDQAAEDHERTLREACAATGMAPFGGPPPPHLPIAWNNPKRTPHRPDEPAAIDPAMAADLAAWLRDGRPTALMAPNDASALVLCAIIRRAGLRVPEDVSVLGCDGTDDLADGGPTRFLASIRPDLAAIGRLAATMALGLVEGRSVDQAPVRSDLLPGRSLGPAAVR